MRVKASSVVPTFRFDGGLAVNETSNKPFLDENKPTLPSEFYRDEQMFRSEMERLFSNKWICIGREEHVAKARHYITAQIGSENIVVLRNDDGALKAFHNVCRHRGSRLLSRDRGRLPSRSIVCPYHAFTYDLNGNLSQCPRALSSESFSKENYPLYPVNVATWGGFVFVHLSDSPQESLSTHLGELPEIYRRYHLDELRLGYRKVVTFNANWKVYVENFLECFHCPITHPELCRLFPVIRQGIAGWQLPEASGKSRVADGVVTMTMDGKTKRPFLRDLSKDEIETVFRANMLWPNITLVGCPDFVHVHTIVPVSSRKTEITFDWLFEEQTIKKADFDPGDAVKFWNLVNAQDLKSCETVQLGLESSAHRTGIYALQEKRLYDFNQWILHDVKCDLTGP